MTLSENHLARPAFLVTGTPGAGKSSVARALAARFSPGLHVDLDCLRLMVVTGFAMPGFTWEPEADQQFRLARATAIHMVRSYGSEGFTVVVDDMLGPRGEDPPGLQDYTDLYRRGGVHPVFLKPSLDVAMARAQARGGELLPWIGEVVPPLYRSMERHLTTGWTVVDSSDLDINETVDEIFARTGVRNPAHDRTRAPG
jgi:chloramphenicol 3-O-phosphotransferase